MSKASPFCKVFHCECRSLLSLRRRLAIGKLRRNHGLADLRPDASNPVPMLGTALALRGNSPLSLLIVLEWSRTMIALASQFRRTPQRLSSFRVRYDAPADLLPWADPYIASLFAEDLPAQAEIDTVLEEADDEPI